MYLLCLWSFFFLKHVKLGSISLFQAFSDCIIFRTDMKKTDKSNCRKLMVGFRVKIITTDYYCNIKHSI